MSLFISDIRMSMEYAVPAVPAVPCDSQAHQMPSQLRSTTKPATWGFFTSCQYHSVKRDPKFPPEYFPQGNFLSFSQLGKKHCN